MLATSPNDDIVYVGVDEAGRGCLCGPVVAAAVIWNPKISCNHEELGSVVCKIRDSKQISKRLRHELADFIKENVVDYAISFIDNKVIDEINILNSTHKAMHNACHELIVDFDHILVDGNSFPKFKDYNHTCVVKGDDTFICIAAASILAKTARDDYMQEVSAQHPQYHWNTNAGYGTKDHVQAIKEYGLTELHRMSFYPCSQLIKYS